MKIKKRHISLGVGIFLVFISFLFFGRQTNIYNKILSLGLLISSVSYLSILLSKTTSKVKLSWTIFIIGAGIFCNFSSPYLIKCSYLIYTNTKETELDELTKILIKYNGNAKIYKDTIITQQINFSTLEKEKLKKLLESTDAYIIEKSDHRIYVGLWGFLDIRHGIFYPISKKMQAKSSRNLYSNWYY